MTNERRTAQALQELHDLVEDMRNKARHLHGLHDGSEWPYDLDTFADRLDSSVRYLTGDDQ